MFERLDRQLAAWYSLLGMGGLLVLTGIAIVAMASETQTRTQDTLRTVAGVTASAAAPFLDGTVPDTSLADLATQVARQASASVQILAPDGRLLATADSRGVLNGPEVPGNAPEVRQALQPGAVPVVRRDPQAGRTVLFAAAAIITSGQPAGVVRVVAPAPTLLGGNGRTLATLLIASGSVGLASAGVAVLLGQSATRPLRRLAQVARRLAAGYPMDRIASDAPQEVVELSAAIAELASMQQAELAARTAESNRANAILANMDGGIIIVNQSWQVARVNPAAARLLRLNGPVEGRSLPEVVRDHEIQQVLRAALATRTPQSASVRLALPPTDAPAGAEPQFLRVTGIAVPGEGTAAGPAGLLVLQDETDIRRAEVIRREFVGNVSHELRTPIASLKALVETLESGALNHRKAAREFLALMHVEVDNLAQLVGELLELSRIESRQMTLRAAAVPPSGIGEEAVRRLLVQADRASVTVIQEVEADLPPVWADSARIIQVLINLIQNALKFTPAGGQVTLDISRCPEGVQFSVRDTGIGVSPADLPRIFERFYKVDRSRATGGTGLGLAIAKHLVRAHGGRIWAESAGEGQGTTLSFTLPLAPVEEDTVEAARVPPELAAVR